MKYRIHWNTISIRSIPTTVTPAVHSGHGFAIRLPTSQISIEEADGLRRSSPWILPWIPVGGRLDRGVEDPPRTPRSGKPGGFLCKDRTALNAKMIRNEDFTEKKTS